MARRRAATICLPFGAVRGVARYRPRDPSIRAVPHSRPTGWSVFRWDVLDGRAPATLWRGWNASWSKHAPAARRVLAAREGVRRVEGPPVADKSQ
jgi:hypothetical protein